VLDLVEHMTLIRDVLADVRRRYPGLEPVRLQGELMRQMIGRMVADVLVETRRRLAEAAPASADAVRRLGRPLVVFSAPLRAYDGELKAFLQERMYRHDRIRRTREAVHEVVKDLFRLYLADPGRLPAEWRQQTEGLDETGVARVVADYIAGMTDRFALSEHRRLVTDRTIKDESLQLFL
jgi:dGTPase